MCNSLEFEAWVLIVVKKSKVRARYVPSKQTSVYSGSPEIDSAMLPVILMLNISVISALYYFSSIVDTFGGVADIK